MIVENRVPASPALRRRGALRRALLVSCAIGGVLAEAQVLAQATPTPPPPPAGAFEGNPTTVSGNVTYSRFTAPVAGEETITVDSPSAIIDWQPYNPNDNPIIFLPEGHTARFENGINSPNGFAVLNRIVATNPVKFDGTVISRLRDYANNTSAPGGTVLFSTPGGIILGATAFFDVGNLVLTTLNVDESGYGEFIGANSALSLSGGANAPNAAIVIEQGARIDALSENSFVAMIAPQVIAGGELRVNGSVAYIAGEEVQMQVSQGLFDIQVTTGTDNATPIVHTGNTGGPSSTGGADHHRIYAVAVPKNQAITLMLQGTMGFDAATDVSVENGAIVLSAGYTDPGLLFGSNPDVDPANPAQDASIHIVGGDFTSRVEAWASDDVLASGSASGGLSFADDVGLYGRARSHLFAGDGETVRVGGNLLLDAAQDRPTGLDAIGGDAQIYALGSGRVQVDGDVRMNVWAEGRFDSVTGEVGTGTGGTARIYADAQGAASGAEGGVAIAGNVFMFSDGYGGENSLDTEAGGLGTGGTNIVEAFNNGYVTVGGRLTATTNGWGGFGGGAGIGATGIGGTNEVRTATGGRITAGELQLFADGTGGQMDGGDPTSVGGTGEAGISRVYSQGGSIAVTGEAIVSASGYGAHAVSGGTGVGGNAGIQADAGTITFGSARVDAQGVGASAQFGPGGRGGDGQGGSAYIEARQTTTEGGTITGDSATVNASGLGGSGGAGDGTIAAGAGGDGTGGTFTGALGSGGAFVLAQADRGTLQIADVQVTSSGFGGVGGFGGAGQAGGAGGIGTGGTAQAGTFIGGGDGTILAGSATFGDLSVDADGIGGSGGSGGSTDDDSGTGGLGQGGAAFLTVRGVAVGVDTARLSSDGIGGFGGNGGDGLGGGSRVVAELGGALTVNVAIDIGSEGFGGTGTAADAFSAGGFGGEVLLQALTGGSITVVGTATLDSIGSGGDLTTSFRAAGVGEGGAIEIEAFGGDIDFGDVTLVSSVGFGGDGGDGGIGQGGSISISATEGAIRFGLMELTASGFGGDAPSGVGGDGGFGVGGAIDIYAFDGTSPSTIEGTELFAFAQGSGGTGGNADVNVAPGSGGNGRGGSVALFGQHVNGSMAIANVLLQAAGLGGDGGFNAGGDAGAGGFGAGGSVEAGVDGTPATGPYAGTTTFGSLGLQAFGFGGNGGSGGFGEGGQATVRTATGGTLQADGVSMLLDGFAGSSSGTASPTAAYGYGGTGEIINNGSTTLGSASISANGTGGTVGDSPPVGAARGGDIQVISNEGVLQVGNAFLTAVATGADDFTGDGPGPGRIQIGASAGNGGLVTGDNIAANADGLVTLGDMDFTSQIFAGADYIEVIGAAAAPFIALASLSLDIRPDALLGEPGALIELYPFTTGGEIVVGGDGGAGYQLTAAEIDRIRALRLSILPGGSGGGGHGGEVVTTTVNGADDVIVRDVTIDAGQIGQFAILTPGNVIVEGGLLMANAGLDNGIQIAAEHRLRVITPGGSIRVRDADGLPGGFLDLFSNQIWVTDAAIMAQLESDPDYAGRDEDLLANNGPVVERGYVEAGTVDLTVTDSLFVQNSGTAEEFAGIAAGAGGLTIFGAGTEPAMVYAFGRAINPDGSAVTGNAFFEQTAFAGTFTETSALNLCLIVSGVCPAEPVEGGAFLGDPTTRSGSVTYSRFADPIVGEETITIESPTAIIDWLPYNPSENPILFLPEGHVATFENGTGTAGFAVLNRILATNPVKFDGTVISRLRDHAAGSSAPGGTILFSTPGGIILGATALFDVGNLVLTTLGVDEFGYGEFIGEDNALSLSGGGDVPDAAIVTEAGSRILAASENSFVALIAPRLDVGGETSVNGSAALVAGEAVRMRVRDGLFDLFVDTGTDNEVPIVHTGTTGGPASSGDGDNHRIYMVAVPKTQAITLDLRGTVGFDAAEGGANGAILLSAGGSVSGDTISPADPEGEDASIHLRGTWTSRVDGRARTDFFALADNVGGDLSVTDLAIRGGEHAHLGATGGFTAQASGDVAVSTDAQGTGAQLGGESLIYAENGGTVTIAGNADVSASAAASGEEASARGGTAHVFADGATVTVAGTLGIAADGNGSNGASGFGGLALLTAPNGGSATAAGAVVTANGTSRGGTVILSTDGGGEIVLQQLLAEASGESLGRVDVFVGSGSRADLGAAELFAEGSFENLEQAHGVEVTVEGGAEGPALTASSLAIRSGSDIRIVGVDGGQLVVAGALDAQAAGTITVAEPPGQIEAAAVSPSEATVRAGSISMAAETIDSHSASMLADEAMTLAAGNLLVAGDLQAGTAMTLSAGGTARFSGTASAPTITVTSSDIDINSNGQLGEQGVTDLLRIRARSTGAPVVIGGETTPDPETDGYHLAQSEAERIEADSIFFDAVGTQQEGSSAVDVLIQDLTMGGSQTEGGGASEIALTTQGRVRIVGDVLYGAAGAEDQLSIDAGDRIELITDGASLRVVDAQGNLSGSLTLQADDVWVASADVVGRLADDRNFEGRNDALLANSGEEQPRGFVEAGGMTISVRDSLFVQNTGSQDEFGGLTVGSGGLRIRGTGSGEDSEGGTQVYAFGRRIDADGSAVTGEEFFREVDFDTAESSYTDDAEFNRCLIVGGTCGGGPDIPPEVISSDTVTGPTQDEGGVGIDVGQMGVELVDTSSLEPEPVIVEPVTSGGDSNLWSDDDDDDEEEDDDDEDDGEDDDDDENEEEGGN